MLIQPGVVTCKPSQLFSGFSKTISLQTRQGEKIENIQMHLLSTYEKAQFSALVQQYRYTTVMFKGEPTAIYNCHGMTFACRRTGIQDYSEIVKILQQDSYKEIEEISNVCIGDIILYYDSDGEEVEHSGIIVKEPCAVLGIPIVLSKWGKYKEAIHPANNCPYNFSGAKYYRIIEETS